MALRCASDRCGNGDASGMPDPEMCVSGGDISGLYWMLVSEKMKRGNGFVRLRLTHMS